MDYKTYENVPSNTPIWGYMFTISDLTQIIVNVKPIRGMIVDCRFYEFKEDGITLKKQGVHKSTRFYADSYEEGVKGYDSLVNKQIKGLLHLIEKCKSNLIERDDTNEIY